MNWGWSVSSLAYRLCYSKLMHEIDGFTIGSLDRTNKLKGSRILNVGAGEGTIDIKLARAGAQEIVAIENNKFMQRQILGKCKTDPQYNIISVVDVDMYSGVVGKLATEKLFDVILFRRCLYGTTEQTVNLLREAYSGLTENGEIFIVHPEADKKKYFSNERGGIALGHMAKWHISNIGATIRGLDYQRFTTEELEELCIEACPSGKVEMHVPTRPAYNIATITKQ